MTTAAAIDRDVHHSVILELNVKSFRAEAAQERTRPKRGQKERESEEDREENAVRRPKPVGMWITADAVPHIPTGSTKRGKKKIQDPAPMPWKRKF